MTDLEAGERLKSFEKDYDMTTEQFIEKVKAGNGYRVLDGPGADEHAWLILAGRGDLIPSGQGSIDIEQDEIHDRVSLLVARGWHPVSNKYHRIARVKTPPVSVAMTLSDAVPAWLQDRMREEYVRWSGEWGARVHGEIQQLTEAEFTVFKSLYNRR